MVLAPHEETAPARRMVLAGAAVEIAAAESILQRRGLSAEPYQIGLPGRLMRAARAMTATAAVATAMGGRRSPLVSKVAGAACVAASVLTRFAIFEAGRASARDPKYVVVPQRERMERRAKMGV